MKPSAEALAGLLRDLREMVPAREVLEKLASAPFTSEEGQAAVLAMLQEDPIISRYPPSRRYVQSLLKSYMDTVAAAGEECSEALLEIAIGSAGPNTKERICYKSYDSGVGRPPITLRLSEDLSNVGMTSWEAGFLLAEVIMHRPELTRGLSVLEVGSGIGLTGVAAARCAEARELWLTDFSDEILQNLEGNLRINDVPFVRGAGADPGGVHTGILDLESPESIAAMPPCDVLLAADMVYDPRLTAGLVAAIARHCRGRAGAFALVASAVRKPSTFGGFLEGLRAAGMATEPVNVEAVRRVFRYRVVQGATLSLLRVSWAAPEPDDDGPADG
eukprot:tig00020960_g16609.t1